MHSGVKAAEAALLVLHHMATEGKPGPVGVRLRSDGEVLSLEVAAAALAGMTKPLSCTASVVPDGAIAVTCLEVSDAHPDLAAALFRDVAATVRELAGRDIDAGDDVVQVMLRASGGSLLLPLQEVRSFLMDYRFEFMLGVESPDRDARDHGAIAVLSVRTGEVELYRE
jgi:hypothetical protein